MNPWIEFVKKFSKDNNLTYKEAMKEAKQFYKPNVKLGGDLKSAINRIGGNFDYTTSTKQAINKFKDRYIINIKIKRSPISVSAIVDMAKSLNSTIKQNFKNKPYDELYHLFMILTLDNNKKVLVEKNEVINIKEYDNIPRKNEETLNINIVERIKFKDLLMNTENLMKNKYFTYSAFNNNCQNFLLSILQANNILNNESQIFIKQDVKNLIGKKTQRGLKVLTDIGGFGSQLFN